MYVFITINLLILIVACINYINLSTARSAGRDFDVKNIADSSAILLNQSAVSALHLTPQEMIGKTVIRPDWVIGYSRPDSTKAPETGLVIGVIEDFPFRSMHRKIEPLAISPKPHTADRIIHVRLPAGRMAEKIQFLETSWKKIFPTKLLESFSSSPAFSHYPLPGFSLLNGSKVLRTVLSYLSLFLGAPSPRLPSFAINGKV